MGKTTKLNPVCQTDGVKNHTTPSLSDDKKISLTAMPLKGVPEPSDLMLVRLETGQAI